MTLRERWIENRRRQALGLRSIDANGQEIVPRVWNPPVMTIEQEQQLCQEIAATYNPASREYRRYQGD